MLLFLFILGLVISIFTNAQPTQQSFPTVAQNMSSRLLQQIPSSEICNEADQDIDYTDVTTITIDGTPQTFTFDKCLKFFKYKVVSNIVLDKYLAFEVWFIDFSKDLDFNPMLIQSKNKKPYLYFQGNDGHVEADTQDWNAYMNRKKYHRIVIEPNELEVGDEIFLALYNVYRSQGVYYEFDGQAVISVSQSNDPTCPDSCSNEGTCNRDGECECNKGRYDLDCSATASKITMDDEESYEIESLTWKYLYYQMEPKDNMRIDFNKDNSAPTEIALYFNSPDEYWLPNPLIGNTVFSIDADQSHDKVVYSSKTVERYQDDTLMIGIFNHDENKGLQIRVKISVDDASDQVKLTIMYVLIGVSVFLIVLWGIITIIKYKTHRDAPEAQNQLEGERTNQAEQQALTAEQLDEYFPKKQFSELHSTFEQTLCSICLEDFTPETECRQIYCEHIYHPQCIGSWLQRNNSCPNCKKIISKEAVDEYLKAKEEGRLPKDSTNQGGASQTTGPSNNNPNVAAGNPEEQKDQNEQDPNENNNASPNNVDEQNGEEAQNESDPNIFTHAQEDNAEEPKKTIVLESQHLEVRSRDGDSVAGADYRDSPIAKKGSSGKRKDSTDSVEAH